MEELTPKMIETIRGAAKKLTGAKRRAFEAQVSLDYLGGDPQLTETVFGWSRHTVAKGLKERRTGQTIPDAPRTYKPKTEDARPQLAQDIIDLVEPDSQTDPKFQGLFKYTRLTAKAVREMLIEHKGYTSEELPHQDTIGQMLDRLGYKMRRVQKAKPKKKIKETDAIFENVHRINAESDARENSLRISIDVKAILKLGELSRRGKARGKEAVKAQDKDMDVKERLVPFGILEVVSGIFTLIFGTSRETSDFLADCLDLWWEERKEALGHIRELVINLDNGPSLASSRTQFVKRMIEFADRHGLEIHLVYYPPYHSKYNPVERCWSALERKFSGVLLNCVRFVLECAQRMTWNGKHPEIQELPGEYPLGVKLSHKEMRPWEARLERSPTLPKYDITIKPQKPFAAVM